MNFPSNIKSFWKKEYTYSIIITFVIGLITHMYKFTNNLPNHDSMYNFYNDQNVLGSGRWLLSLACGFSSYYDLPWVNGVLSLLFIALTVIVILNIFEIKNKFLIVLINGLIISYPSTTEIFCFEFTADGYMIAMFLSSLSVYLIKKGFERSKKVSSILFAAILLCLSCGIYQAYISFALVLFICYYIWIVFTDKMNSRTYLSYIISMILSLVIGLTLYYLIWKICMLVQCVQPNAYQGINQEDF